MTLTEKKRQLIESLRALESVAVAFSAGVDSTFLLKCAQEALGQNVLAVTVRSNSFPGRECVQAERFTEKHHIRHAILDFDELSVSGFAENPPDRCYLCKRALFKEIRALAEKYGIRHVAEGSNRDDLGDYRPGLKAIEELDILSPLRQAQLDKQEIRALSRQMGLDTWDKPAYACLSTRIPYGEEITREKLKAIGEAEQYLFELGFRQVRVRHHGSVARIELERGDIEQVFARGLAQQIHEKMKSLGFVYAALDLGGYRTGSLNTGLTGAARE